MTSDITCGCCELTPLARVERDSDDRRPRLCAECREPLHVQFSAQRDQDHRAMWKRHHGATVAKLSATIAGLRDELADPHTQVREATERAESAYRTRDRALAAMSYVEELHHAKDAKLCTCGSSQAECVEFRAAHSVRDLLQPWESRNKERMEQNKPHALPIDHPVVGDRRGWVEWLGAPRLP